MYGYTFLVQLLYFWNLSTWYLGGLFHPHYSRRLLKLSIGFLMDYSDTLGHSVADSHLDISSLADINIDAC